jgi:hypothetical protein
MRRPHCRAAAFNRSHLGHASHCTSHYLDAGMISSEPPGCSRLTASVRCPVCIQSAAVSVPATTGRRETHAPMLTDQKVGSSNLFGRAQTGTSWLSDPPAHPEHLRDTRAVRQIFGLDELHLQRTGHGDPGLPSFPMTDSVTYRELPHPSRSPKLDRTPYPHHQLAARVLGDSQQNLRKILVFCRCQGHPRHRP